MISASIIFWLVCAIPLVGTLIYLLKKDKLKGKYGIVVLAFLLFAAVATIIYLTKDFSLKYGQ